MVILLFPMVALGQPFIINYTPSNNTLRVNYTGCEICLLGTAGAVAACECVRTCTEELPAVLYDCQEFCYENFGMQAYDYNLLRECNDDCETQYAIQVGQCKKKCGVGKPIRNITRMVYTLHAAWAVLGSDPRTSQNRVSSPEMTVVGPTIVIPSYQPPAPWPEIHFGRNVCYGITVRIFYDDGVVCGGNTFWNCQIRG